MRNFAFGFIVLCAFQMTDAAESRVVADATASADWIAQALQSSGYNADYSIDSLKEIDRFFDEQAPDGIPVSGGLLSEQVGMRLFALGAYVGETIRRAGNGVWRGDDSDPRAEVNVEVVMPNGMVMWPVQRVMKRFKNGPDDGIYGYGLGATNQ